MHDGADLRAGAQPTANRCGRRRLRIAGRASDAITALWNEWDAAQAQPLGSGRRSFETGSGEVLVVWREDGDELLAFAASPQPLLDAWRHTWANTDVTVALENRDGRPVAGHAISPSSGFAVVKPAAETRLPWTLRIAAMSTPADIAAAAAARRRMIVAGLVLLAILIPATGYLVTRTVRKELALARQQAGFVSAVSHEFRSPLTSLVHLTSLLRSDFQPTEDRRRQYYNVLATETDRLRRFVETLLDFGRIQAGATRYHLAPVDLGARGERGCRGVQTAPGCGKPSRLVGGGRSPASSFRGC